MIVIETQEYGKFTGPTLQSAVRANFGADAEFIPGGWSVGYINHYIYDSGKPEKHKATVLSITSHEDNKSKRDYSRESLQDSLTTTVSYLEWLNGELTRWQTLRAELVNAIHSEGSLTVAELAERIDMSKQSVYSMIESCQWPFLEEVEFDEEGSISSKWLTNAERLSRFVNNNGRLPKQRECSEGRWLSAQNQEEKKGNLSIFQKIIFHEAKKGLFNIENIDNSEKWQEFYELAKTTDSDKVTQWVEMNKRLNLFNGLSNESVEKLQELEQWNNPLGRKS